MGLVSTFNERPLLLLYWMNIFSINDGYGNHFLWCQWKNPIRILQQFSNFLHGMLAIKNEYMYIKKKYILFKIWSSKQLKCFDILLPILKRALIIFLLPSCLHIEISFLYTSYIVSLFLFLRLFQHFSGEIIYFLWSIQC